MLFPGLDSKSLDIEPLPYKDVNYITHFMESAWLETYSACISIFALRIMDLTSMDFKG